MPSLLLTAFNLTELPGSLYKVPFHYLPLIIRFWLPHSLLDKQRIHASVVQLKRGSLLLGGWGAPNTSSILTDSVSTVLLGSASRWQKGPDLISQGALYSCAVSIGADRALLVGGILEPRQVILERQLFTGKFVGVGIQGQPWRRSLEPLAIFIAGQVRNV